MNSRPLTPAGLKAKEIIGIPWRLAFALQQDGWFLRSDIVWNKPNAMPESVRDRPSRCHEYLFLFAKEKSYYYDWASIQEPAKGGQMKRKGSVWSVNTQAFRGAHFATFPPELIRPCILSSSREYDFVLDPFFGAGTVGLVCNQSRRNYIGIELNPTYVDLAMDRLTESHAQASLIA